MATQDDINNLTDQINAELQSATLLEQQITKEQQNSAQKVNTWQEQARRHHDTATHLQQNLETKQKQLTHEQEQADADRRDADDKKKRAAEEITRHLLF